MSSASSARAGSGAGFTDRMREAADPFWEAQHEHPFVRGIGDGTLDPARFRHYVVQDYVFLIESGRFFGLACARAPRPADAAVFARLAHETFAIEMDLRRSFAGEWGLTREELEREPMTPTTRSYADYLLRTAALGDFAELVAALLPCIVGYREIGERLAERGLPEEARYARWIELYSGDDFGDVAEWFRTLADRVAEEVDGDGRRRMLRAFVESSRHELAFWEAVWRLEKAPAA